MQDNLDPAYLYDDNDGPRASVVTCLALVLAGAVLFGGVIGWIVARALL